MLSILKNSSRFLKAILLIIVFISTQLSASNIGLESASNDLFLDDPVVLNITTDEVLMQSGNDYQIDFFADANIYGFQYTLNFDSLRGFYDKR